MTSYTEEYLSDKLRTALEAVHVVSTIVTFFLLITRDVTVLIRSLRDYPWNYVFSSARDDASEQVDHRQPCGRSGFVSA